MISSFGWFIFGEQPSAKKLSWHSSAIFIFPYHWELAISLARAATVVRA